MPPLLKIAALTIVTFVGAISSFIQGHNAFTNTVGKYQQKRQRVIFFTIFVILTVVFAASAIITSINTFSANEAQTSTTSPQSTTTPFLSNPATSSITQTVFASTPTPTPTLTPEPTPTATPVPVKAGTVICENNFSAWGPSGNWQVVGSSFVHEATGDSQPILAPCNIPNNNYIVEVQFRAGNPSSTNVLNTELGVLARVQDSNNGYEAYIYTVGWYVKALSDAGYKTGSNTYYSGNYTLKLTVNGTEEIFDVDGNILYDDRPSWATTNAGHVGILCSDSCEVSDFKVIAA